MLINIFGLWLMAANIMYLEKSSDPADCRIYFTVPIDHGYEYQTMVDKSCDVVAEEINKQLKKK